MSVAYTLGVMPAGYVAEQGYGYLAATAGAGYVLVALLYAISLKGVLPLERAPRLVLFEGLRDSSLLRFAAVAFIFPFSMGLVVSATPLFAADGGVGEGYIGLVLGANSILVAALALPVAARIEASGPLRYLGAAAMLVAATHACYAAVPGVAAALLVGTVVFSLAEVIFSSAVPATVARLAPPGRRGAYQGSWALVSSISMGSALFFSGVLRDAVGWRAAWAIFAVMAVVAGVLLIAFRKAIPGTPPGPPPPPG
jgi:predicted MFS family arabinose efflux permease